MKSLHRRFTQRSFHTQKLLHKEVFTQSGFYIQKLLHTKAFTQRSLCTEAPLHEVTSWNWQQFFGKNPCHELFSKNIRNIFLKQVPIQSFQAHTAMKWRVEKSGGADEGRQPLKFGSAGSPRVACPTSVPERLELYGEARPKPPTLRRRAPKNTKNPSGGWGKAFWPESGSLISVSKSIIPPPPDFEGT